MSLFGRQSFVGNLLSAGVQFATSFKETRAETNKRTTIKQIQQVQMVCAAIKRRSTEQHTYKIIHPDLWILLFHGMSICPILYF
jgi:hypothetical protein